jgi:hypothetical protein
VPPRAGAAGPWDRGGGEEREPGAGADGHAAQYAVQRHGAADPGADRPPRQGLGEARARAQGAHAARQVPGARQEAPSDPHQEDQVPAALVLQHYFHLLANDSCILLLTPLLIQRLERL